MTYTVRLLVARFLEEESGQDLIEYGLLTGIVVAMGVIVFTSIQGKMRGAYLTWAANALAISTPNPAGS
jgi:Flp pilus assembly pilin Flp